MTGPFFFAFPFFILILKPLRLFSPGVVVEDLNCIIICSPGILKMYNSVIIYITPKLQSSIMPNEGGFSGCSAHILSPG